MSDSVLFQYNGNLKASRYAACKSIATGRNGFGIVHWEFRTVFLYEVTFIRRKTREATMVSYHDRTKYIRGVDIAWIWPSIDANAN